MKLMKWIVVLPLFVSSVADAAYKKVPSPFLGSVENFQKSDRDKNLYEDRNPNKKVADYDKVIFDRVLIYQPTHSQYKLLTHEEIQSLGDMFSTILKDTFKSDLNIVTEPGPGVLRARFAIRGLKRGNYYMDASGSHQIKPDPKLAAGTYEMDAIDSLTGERILALIQNVGPEEFQKSEKEEIVSTMRESFLKWAETLRRALLEAKATKSIPK